MTDIIKRLRRKGACKLSLEAAVCIENLNREVHLWRTTYDESVQKRVELEDLLYSSPTWESTDYSIEEVLDFLNEWELWRNGL